MSDFFSEKTPTDVLDYSFSFVNWLEPGDTIIAATATTTDTITVDSVVFSTTAAVVWLSAGTANTTSTVAITIETAQGRTKQVCCAIYVRSC